MKNLIALLIALFSATAFAGCGDWNGRGYTRCVEVRDHGHRGQSIGREIAEIGIGTAVGVAAIQIGSAIGGKIAQEISGVPTQQARVVYAQSPQQVVVVATCDTTPFISGGLVYADRCDGSGMGPVVVGRIDRR
ncbi:MAG: hypothetical protein WAU28_03835 [Candidatus Moraniibacteriota bacterium]